MQASKTPLERSKIWDLLERLGKRKYKRELEEKLLAMGEEEEKGERKNEKRRARLEHEKILQP